jgi:5-methylcytosine-specific restriction endonuclease McrA
VAKKKRKPKWYWSKLEKSRQIAKSGPVRIIRGEEAQADLHVAPESDLFLKTYEWRRVRMMALKKYGARCQCCGATPADGVRMHVDHIKPRSLYPALALKIENLQVLCEVCNHGKGNWDSTDWRRELTGREGKEQRDHLRSILGEMEA